MSRGRRGGKNVKALFLNVFCTTKVFERVLRYPFVRKRLCPIFRYKYPTMHRRIEKLSVNARLGKKIDF